MFAAINKLHIVASRWTIINIGYLRICVVPSAAAMYMTSALFWDMKQRRAVIHCR